MKMNPLKQPPQNEKCPDRNDRMSSGSEIKETKLRFSRTVIKSFFSSALDCSDAAAVFQKKANGYELVPKRGANSFCNERPIQNKTQRGIGAPCDIKNCRFS